MTKSEKPVPMDPMKVATTSPQQRFEGAQTGLLGRDVRQETAKTRDLAKDSRDPAPGMTNNQGLGIADDQNSLRVGVRGPTLLEDFQYREKMTHFDHERITERVVHARGFAAHGVFESAGGPFGPHHGRPVRRDGQGNAGIRALLDRRGQSRVGRHAA